MRQEPAEELARDALAWLASDSDLFGVFLGASGMSVGDLRAGTNDPQVLGAVLDFILMDDDWVVGFCDAQGLEYSAPQRARQALPGGSVPEWT